MSDERRRAGLLLRTAARAVDMIIIAAAMEVIPRAGFFAGIAYILLEDGLFQGKSIGKRLIGLKVVTETDKPCTFRESILRNSTLAVGLLVWRLPWIGWIFAVTIFCIEFILILGSNDGRRLGDEVAKTLVLEG